MRGEALGGLRAKTELRRRLLARRAAVPIDERRRAAERAAEALLTASAVRQARIVLLHHPIGAELPLGSLPERLRALGVRLGLPRGAASDDPLELRRWDAEATLRPDAFGVPAPGPEAPRLRAEEVDVVVVPAVAVDASGWRLGRGGGHYDRLLPRLEKAWRVGWVLAFQRVERLPREPHDQRLDAVVSEAGLQRFGPRAEGRR